MSGATRSWVCLLGLLWVLGCGRDQAPGFTLPPLSPPQKPDAGAPKIPKGATPCTEDSECDDGVGCTRDLCVAAGYCVQITDRARCDDGVFCNGLEYCDPEADCQPSTARGCADDDVCTIDSCDEASKSCVHAPRDEDGDGEVDWHCVGGTDCDDRDPTRGSLVAEICDDSIDNDCDGAVDEAAGCGRPLHDTCADALDIAGGESMALRLTGASPDYTLGCVNTALAPRDVALRLTLDQPHDVTVTARGRRSNGGAAAVFVALRSDCGQLSSELDCREGVTARSRARGLGPGTYYVLVASATAAEARVDVELMPTTNPPTNSLCEAPLDLDGVRRIAGSFVDVTDDYELQCGFSGAPELVYGFSLGQTSDMRVSFASTGDEQTAFALRSRCQDAASTLHCVRGAPAQARLRSIPPGSYYLITEGPSYREVDFVLDATFHPPTEDPPGESCARPEQLELNAVTPSKGTLSGLQDRVQTSCGPFFTDAVYRFDLSAPADVLLEVPGARGQIGVAVSSACDKESELICTRASTVHARLRNLLAGSYFVVVEAASATTFTVKATTAAPTKPLAVSGNDTCANATAIPATGGVYRGDTSRLLKDYEANCGGNARASDAAYVLDLPGPKSKRVHARLEASGFDAVLYRFADRTGAGPQACMSRKEAKCHDGGSTLSVLDETLSPGRYYYVVDGFNINDAGPYVFDVHITDP